MKKHSGSRKDVKRSPKKSRNRKRKTCKQQKNPGRVVNTNQVQQKQIVKADPSTMQLKEANKSDWEFFQNLELLIEKFKVWKKEKTWKNFKPVVRQSGKVGVCMVFHRLLNE